MNNLNQLGYITRAPGKGSFVRIPSVAKDSTSIASFTEDMKKIGLKAGSKLLSYNVISASEVPEIRDKLQLSNSDMIHYIIRLRTGNGIPFAISYGYISARIIPVSKSRKKIPSITHNIQDFELRSFESEFTALSISFVSSSKSFITSEICAALCDFVNLAADEQTSEHQKNLSVAPLNSQFKVQLRSYGVVTGHFKVFELYVSKRTSHLFVQNKPRCQRRRFS